jgi:hypothetical protein
MIDKITSGKRRKLRRYEKKRAKNPKACRGPKGKGDTTPR